MSLEVSNAIKQCQEVLESARVNGSIDPKQVAHFYILAGRLGLSEDEATNLEHQVLGTHENFVTTRQQAAEQYRKAVAEAWADRELEKPEIKHLVNLAEILELSKGEVSNIEQEIIGKTKEDIKVTYKIGREDILKILRDFQPQGDLHVYPGIPQDKLANAKSRCAVPESEHILGLIDCTLFGSAKDCVLFGEEAIYHHMVGTSGKMRYADFPQCAFVWQENFILCLGAAYGQKISTVTSLVSTSKLCDIINTIRQLLLGGDRQANVIPIRTAVTQILGAFQPQGDLHVYPGIPQDKLANAKSQCAVPENEHILGLIDCTFFGSAKDCVLFGEEAIYHHNAAGGDGKIPYSHLPQLGFSVTDNTTVLPSRGDKITTVGSYVDANKLLKILNVIQQFASQ